MAEEKLEDACWEGYEAIGFKTKNGKRVPNCVPKDSKKGVDMEKLELHANEEITIKSMDGKEYVYRNDGLYENNGEVEVSATVLKSLRTKRGAEDWIKLSKKENAKVVTTEVLKGYGSYMGYPSDDMDYHVVMEEQMDPVAAIEEESVSDIVHALYDHGYLELGEYGVSLSEKWYKAMNAFVHDALSEAMKTMKSIDDLDLCCSQKSLVNFLNDVVKSTMAPENTDTGYVVPEFTAVSDEEASSAFEGDAASGVDTSDSNMEGTPISDAEVDTATHLADHNHGDSGVTHEEMEVEKSSNKKPDADGDGVPDWADEHPGEDDHEEEEDTKKSMDEEEEESEEDHEDEETHKSVEEGDSEDEEESDDETQKSMHEDEEEDEEEEHEVEKSVVGTVFKSLREAKAWRNPDPERYHVVPTSFEDKKLYGRNKHFIVAERPPKIVVGAHGNKLV